MDSKRSDWPIQVNVNTVTSYKYESRRLVGKRTKETKLPEIPPPPPVPTTEEPVDNHGSKLKRSVSIKRALTKAKRMAKSAGQGVGGSGSGKSKNNKNPKKLEISLPTDVHGINVDQPLSGVICTPIRSPFIQDLLPSPARMPMSAVSPMNRQAQELPWPETPPIERKLSAILAETEAEWQGSSRFTTAAQNIGFRLKGSAPKKPGINRTEQSPSSMKCGSTSTAPKVEEMRGEKLKVLTNFDASTTGVGVSSTKDSGSEFDGKSSYPSPVFRLRQRPGLVVPSLKPSSQDDVTIKYAEERHPRSGAVTPQNPPRSRLPEAWQSTFGHRDLNSLFKSESEPTLPHNATSSKNDESIAATCRSSTEQSQRSSILDLRGRKGSDYEGYLLDRIRAAHYVRSKLPVEQQEGLDMEVLERMVDKHLMENPGAWLFAESTEEHHEWFLKMLLQATGRPVSSTATTEAMSLSMLSANKNERRSRVISVTSNFDTWPLSQKPSQGDIGATAAEKGPSPDRKADGDYTSPRPLDEETGTVRPYSFVSSPDTGIFGADNKRNSTASRKSKRRSGGQCSSKDTSSFLSHSFESTGSASRRVVSFMSNVDPKRFLTDSTSDIKPVVNLQSLTTQRSYSQLMRNKKLLTQLPVHKRAKVRPRSTSSSEFYSYDPSHDLETSGLSNFNFDGNFSAVAKSEPVSPRSSVSKQITAHPGTAVSISSEPVGRSTSNSKSSITKLLKSHPCGTLVDEPGLKCILFSEAARANFSRFCEFLSSEQRNATLADRRRRSSCSIFTSLLAEASHGEPTSEDPRTTLRKWILANTQITALALARELEAAITKDDPTTALNADIIKLERDTFEKLNSDTFPRYVQHMISTTELNEELEAAILDDLDACVVAASSLDLAKIKRTFGESTEASAPAMLSWTHSFCITNSKQEMRYVSEGFLSMTGYNTVRDLAGCNPRMFQGKGNHSPIDRIVRIGNAVEKNEPVTELLVNYKKNKAPFYNLMMLYPIFDGRRGVIGTNPRYWLGVHFDLTNFLFASCERQLLQHRSGAMADTNIQTQRRGDGLYNEKETRLAELNLKKRENVEVATDVRHLHEDVQWQGFQREHTSPQAEDQNFSTMADTIKYLKDRFSKFFLMCSDGTTEGGTKFTISHVSSHTPAARRLKLHGADFLTRIQSFRRNSRSHVERIRGFLSQGNHFMATLSLLTEEEDSLIYCVPLIGETSATSGKSGGGSTLYLCVLLESADSQVFGTITSAAEQNQWT